MDLDYTYDCLPADIDFEMLCLPIEAAKPLCKPDLESNRIPMQLDDLPSFLENVEFIPFNIDQGGSRVEDISMTDAQRSALSIDLMQDNLLTVNQCCDEVLDELNAILQPARNDCVDCRQDGYPDTTAINQQGGNNRLRSREADTSSGIEDRIRNNSKYGYLLVGYL